MVAYEAASGKPLRQIRLQQGIRPTWREIVALSPDGSLLAVGGDGHTVELHQVGSNAPPVVLGRHQDSLMSLAFSPIGNLLASASTDHTARLFDVAAGKELSTLAGHKARVQCVAFRNDGRVIATASDDQTVRLWDVRTKSPKWVSRALPHGVWQVCFSPDGRKLFSGSKDGSIHRWSLDAPEAPSGFWHKRSGLESVTVAADGKQFAGLRRGGVYVGEAQGVALPSPLPELGTNNTCLFSSDGQVLFAGTPGERHKMGGWFSSPGARYTLVMVWNAAPDQSSHPAGPQ